MEEELKEGVLNRIDSHFERFNKCRVSTRKTSYLILRERKRCKDNKELFMPIPEIEASSRSRHEACERPVSMEQITLYINAYGNHFPEVCVEWFAKDFSELEMEEYRYLVKEKYNKNLKFNIGKYKRPNRRKGKHKRFAVA